MTESITEIERIHLEARQAAAKYDDINLACPYPFGSIAAAEFKLAFEKAKEIPWPFPGQIEAALAADKKITGMEVSEIPFEESDFFQDPTLCVCDKDLTLQELDTHKCQACGLEIPL